MPPALKEAVLWEPLPGNLVQCRLCNFRCRIAENATGLCQVRRNIGGKLYSLSYHAVCAVAVDPIEKKPLFHFQPGSRSYSLAAVGCNFRCAFCQNWQISQLPRLQDDLVGRSVAPPEVVEAARRHRCRSISYTYTEPTVFMELAAECGRLARQEGLANVFVSNGYLTIEAVDYARDFLDAINVDLKAFSDEFYRTICQARLAPLLDTLRHIARQTDIWLEVTTLVVPGRNDSDDELGQIAGFIAQELGPQVPWHISRFHPDYQIADGQPTPAETLERAYDLGRRAGLHYVYVGNLAGCGHESTHCHACGRVLIDRVGYRISPGDFHDGKCPGCGQPLAGRGFE